MGVSQEFYAVFDGRRDKQGCGDFFAIVRHRQHILTIASEWQLTCICPLTSYTSSPSLSCIFATTEQRIFVKDNIRIPFHF